MRLLAKLTLVLACAACVMSADPRLTFHIIGNDTGAWPELLSSIGLASNSSVDASVIVIPNGVIPLGADAAVTDWASRVERGSIVIVEGESAVAQAFGFKPTSAQLVPTRSVEDVRDPEVRIVWEKSLDLPVFEMPPQAQVFAKERWQKAPLLAGYRKGVGAVLWAAAPLGARGYDRFPYLLHALTDLGFEPPFQSRRIWAFFDSAYRSRVDLDYFAARWRASGISALHVAAWHFWERDPQGDEAAVRLKAR